MHSERMQWSWRVVRAVVLAATVAAPVSAQDTTPDLKRMTIEDLLDVEVTTVSRHPEPVTSVPAAVFVITPDDIRRSGAASLPEVLRLAPGLQVARIDGAKWATGMRGFADRLSRAMLVLIDGRAVYSPLFAGTYWEVQDVMLEDVERIEVIRGPGGTLWGANAVNGIINIVTKRADQTQGWLATGEGGAFGHGVGAVRFGGSQSGGTGHYRLYAKGLQRPDEYQTTGDPYDRTTMAQAGARADWILPSGRELTVQGDLYRERLGQVSVRTLYTSPYREVSNVQSPLAGGNVLTRFSGQTAGGHTFQLQAYYDHASRDERPVAERRDTADLDYQQSLALGGRHRVTFGAGYRVSAGRVTARAPTAFSPETQTDHLVSLFGQDEVTLVRERLRASVGLKVEHNAYTGIEAQPSGRLVWTPHRLHTLVASATHAVRTPSRVETDYTTTALASAALPLFVRLVPNPGFRSEVIDAYELGYRVRPSLRTYFTVAGFYNRLNDVLSTELVGGALAEGGGVEPVRAVLPVAFMNGLAGESHGAELTADVRPLDWLRTTLNYSYLKVAVSRDPGAQDVSQEARYEGITPRHQVQAQAALDLPGRVSTDVTVRRASRLASGPVPAYTTASLRIGWQATPRIELSVVGQDLTHARHLEWPGGLPVRRTGYVKVTFRDRP